MCVSSVSTRLVRKIKLDVWAFTQVFEYLYLAFRILSWLSSVTHIKLLFLFFFFFRIEPLCPPQILVTIYQTALYHMPEDSYHIFIGREKSQISCIKDCFLQHFVMFPWLKESWHTWYSKVEWHITVLLIQQIRLSYIFWARFICVS
jgi:hypothetical protein